jgi:hypothetical protein
MAISEFSSGTRTTAGGVEGSPTAIGGSGNATDGIFQLFVDLNALALSDNVEVRLLESALGGGTQRVIFQSNFWNAQDEPMFVSPTFILLHNWTFDIRQFAGASRALPWSIRQVA